MALAGLARVLVHRSTFRTTGLAASGRALVRALGSPDEDVRTLAGISLVQAGRRSEPFLEEALARRHAVPTVLTLLADLGDPACVRILERFTDDPDPEVARAARDALRVLGEQG